jgi:integrase
VWAALATGLRIGHLLALEWRDVDLNANEIVPQGGSHTKRTGVIDLAISPALRAMLVRIRPEPAQGRVFWVTAHEANRALRRMSEEFAAPRTATWAAMRRTCGTFLTNAPGIFGGASAYRSAKQLGHSVQVAERHYTGLIRNIPPSATTVEAAMGVESEVAAIAL